MEIQTATKPERHHTRPLRRVFFWSGIQARYPRRYPWKRAFLAPGKQPPINSEVNSETPHLPRCCYSRCNSKTALLELGVTKETGVCRRLVDSAVDSETALLEPQKTSVLGRYAAPRYATGTRGKPCSGRHLLSSTRARGMRFYGVQEFSRVTYLRAQGASIPHFWGMAQEHQ